MIHTDMSDIRVRYLRLSLVSMAFHPWIQPHLHLQKHMLVWNVDEIGRIIIVIIKTKTYRGMGTLRAKIGQNLKCAKSNIDLLSPIHISDNLDPQKTRNKNLSFRCLRFGGKGNKANFYALSMFDKRSIESLIRR